MLEKDNKNEVGIEDIIHEVPPLMELFPDLPENIIKRSFLENGAWIKRTDTGWIISGIGIFDNDLPRIIANLLLDTNRIVFNCAISCLWQLGEVIRKRICQDIISRLNWSVNDAALSKFAWLIGKLKCKNAKEILTKHINETSNVDLLFECARALARIEDDVNGKGMKILLDIEDTKWKEAIYDLKLELTRKSKENESTHYTKFDLVSKKSPTVFISYSHGEKLDKWLEKFVADLKDKKIIPFFDKDLRFGEYWDEFMDNILNTDFTLLIFTKGYIEKWKKRSGGVAYEKRLIKELTIKGIEPRRIIPIIKHKETKSNLPEGFGLRNYCDFSTYGRYKKNIKKLIKNLLE